MKTKIALTLGKEECPWNPVELEICVDEKTTPRIGAIFAGQGRGYLLGMIYQHKLAPRNLWHIATEFTASFGLLDFGQEIKQGHEHKDLQEAIECVKTSLNRIVQAGVLTNFEVFVVDANTLPEIQSKCIDAAMTLKGLDCRISAAESLPTKQ